MLARLLRLVFLFIVLVGTQSYAAPWLQKNENDFVKAELISDLSSVVPASTVEAGILLTHKDGWHTYWKTTGDSGLPTSIEWKLPEGWQAGEIQWPVPQVFTLGDLVNYGYSGKVLLPVQIKIPGDVKPGTPVELDAEVSWLMCAEQCVPGRASLNLKLDVASAAKPSTFSDLFKSTLSALPKELNKVESEIDEQKKLIKLTFRDPGSIEDLYVFAETEESISYIAPQKVFPENEGFSVYLTSTDTIKAGDDFSGLIVANKGSGHANGWAASFKSTLKKASLSVPQAAESLSVNSSSLFLTAFFAFIGGLILNLMPCVFPVLSLKILGIVENRHTGKLYPHAFGFLAGVLLSMCALAMLLIFIKSTGAAVGWGFQLQSPYFVAFLAVLFVAIAANLWGFFEFTLGGGVANSINSSTKKRNPFIESFLTGILVVFVASPCTAPFMGAAVGYALSASLAETLLIFLSLGFGMALPWFVLTMFPVLTAWLPKPGHWMVVFKKVMAVPMVLTAVWLFWVLEQQTSTPAFAAFIASSLLLLIALYLFGRQQFGKLGSTKPVLAAAIAFLLVFSFSNVLNLYVPKATITYTADSWSAQKVDDLLKQGKPVFVDFTASWCVTCQANKIAVLKTEEIQYALKENGFVFLEADWTNYDENITQVLQHFGRSGVPLYVIYRPGADVQILPELLTKSIVLDALNKKN